MARETASQWASLKSAFQRPQARARGSGFATLAETALLVLLEAKPVGGIRLPVIGLTRRGDLKYKLAAFEAGVDDIMTVPFAPEELLARVIALVRRAYGDAVTFRHHQARRARD